MQMASIEPGRSIFNGISEQPSQEDEIDRESWTDRLSIKLLTELSPESWEISLSGTAWKKFIIRRDASGLKARTLKYLGFSIKHSHLSRPGSLSAEILRV